MSKTTIYDEIFEDIDENMKKDTFYTWDEVSERFFKIKVYPKGSAKRDRNTYIITRNCYMQAINNLAFKYKKGWMLFIGKHNTHIVKTSDKKLLEKICDIRTAKFFNSCSAMAKQGTWILENEYIDQEKEDIQAICK